MTIMANHERDFLTFPRSLIVRQINNTGLLDPSQELHHNTSTVFPIVPSSYNYLRTTMNGTYTTT